MPSGSWQQRPGHDGPGSKEAEAARARTDRLQLLLPGLVARRVPARLLEPGPVTGVGRLRMADGTTLLVSSPAPGTLARVVKALITKRRVLVSSWCRSGDRLELTFSGVPGRQPVVVVVEGPDQPD